MTLKKRQSQARQGGLKIGGLKIDSKLNLKLAVEIRLTFALQGHWHSERQHQHCSFAQFIDLSWGKE
jgi:hypothetical protein